MVKIEQAAVGAFVLALLAACNTPPPRTWLRYQPDGKHDWTPGNSGGVFVARLHGADIALDLHRPETPVLVTVTNTSGAPVEMRMGADTPPARVAIGEVLLRPLDGPPGGPDMLPYNSMQAVVVEGGWRGTFHLDRPLGRDLVLGQILVLTVEVRNKAGELERRKMPLIASNAGTVPTDGR